MANALFDNARARYLEGLNNWLTDTIKVVAIDTGNYSVNLATHTTMADVSGTGRIATSGALTNKAITGGAADADDVTLSSVTGNSIEAIIIYSDGGTDSTSFLIAYLDTATGLPITPNGGDIILTWDNGPNKIFKL